LVAFDTVNPPGRERDAIEYCGQILKAAGFDLSFQMDAATSDRVNLIATRGIGHGSAIGFSAHLDTVPFGQATWKNDPLRCWEEGGRLFGRGTSDMKGGVAAMLVACQQPYSPPGGIVVILSFGEETGCEGARLIASACDLPRVGALVVPESTGNRIAYGHKGVLWLRMKFRGVTSHGARPWDGENAIRKAMDALQKIHDLDLGDEHPVVGAPSLNLGTIQGGLNTNSVPDLCEATVDFRTLPGSNHRALVEQIGIVVGADVQIDVLLDLPALWTETSNDWASASARLVASASGVCSVPFAVPYFTDACILTPALGNPPTLILGPGDPAQPHTTDESVSISNLEQSVLIYKGIIERWNGAWAE
jgi:succinyl-diaminopimelate desuccinylase